MHPTAPAGPNHDASFAVARGSSRGWARTRSIASAGFLLALLALTAFNATWSKALGQARAAEARGDFPAALTAALAHLERRPWSREASLLAARCLSRLDYAELAEARYHGQNPTVVDLHYRAYGLVRANLRERAVEAYREILAIRPDDVAALRAQAGVLLASSQWAEVARIGRQLAAMPPGPVLAESPLAVAGHWTLRPARVESVPALGSTLEGLACHDDGDPEPAIVAFERVLAIDPEFRTMPLAPSMFWSCLAADLLKVGRAGDAVNHLERAIKQVDDPDLLLLLGNAHEQSGAIEAAEATWRKVLDARPDQPGAWLNLGRIALQKDNPEEAVRRLDRARQLLPESYDVAYNLGLANRRLGRIGPAKEAEARAEELRRRSDAPAPPARTEITRVLIPKSPQCPTDRSSNPRRLMRSSRLENRGRGGSSGWRSRA